MKYMYAQSAHKRFKWELDVALTNLYSLDPSADVVVLFAFATNESQGIHDYIANKYPQAEVHMYADTRSSREYAATYRPFLWYCYLSEDPARERETYFQVESDVIFREIPDFSKIPADKHNWYASDCSGYISADYITSTTRGEEILNGFANTLKLPVSVLRSAEGVGAHWLMVEPTAKYWLKVYRDCDRLYHYLRPIDSNIQKWTAEMWAQLYNAYYFGITYHSHPELEFSMATDHISRWNDTKIMHNNGVFGDNSVRLFYKGAYNEREPFGDDFGYVAKDKVSSKYVEAVKAVML